MTLSARDDLHGMSDNRRQRILKMEIDDHSPSQAMDLIHHWADSGQTRYICVSNVHQCMETFDDPEFRDIINAADMIIPDSRILAVAFGALRRRSSLPVLRGVDLTLGLCQRCAEDGIPVGFYGGTEESLTDLKKNLLKQFPSLNIACAIAPPFRELTTEEMKAHAAAIQASQVRLLFVGIGCPKQERWMSEQIGRLPIVMIGVGAAFDFIAGVVRASPAWVHPLGLEWLYRLLREPRRLWKRYLKHNPRFLFHLCLQMLGRKYSP